MIFLTTVWNALDRPRSHNSEMAKIMYRDGSMYFFVRVFLLDFDMPNMLICMYAHPRDCLVNPSLTNAGSFTC